jgi:class 3 adenylate cyclase
VPTKQVIHPLLAHLTYALSRHNARAEDGTRFQLRVALDVGPVESDAEGLTGQVINRTARLVDAPVLKKRLTAAGLDTCVGFIASDAVYNDVIKQHPGQLDPASYQKVSWLAKGRRFTGWIKLSPDDDATPPRRRGAEATGAGDEGRIQG